MDPPPSKRPLVKGGLAATAMVALAIAVHALPGDEGKRNVGYRDLAGIPTVCFGHTGADVAVGTHYSDGECKALLSEDAQAHLVGVLHCTPDLGGRPDQLAAATRLAFNIGVGNYCRSTTARLFNARNWRGGCDAFGRWVNVNGRVVQGLVARRKRERADCLKGLS